MAASLQNKLNIIGGYLSENKNRPFKWGEFDCCTMACDIVTLLGGEDFAKDVRGKYDNAVGAKRVLLNEFGSIEEAFSPLEEVDINFIQRGDLVLMEVLGEKLMAIRYGEGYYCLEIEEGMGLMEDIGIPIKAWRVG